MHSLSGLTVAGSVRFPCTGTSLRVVSAAAEARDVAAAVATPSSGKGKKPRKSQARVASAGASQRSSAVHLVHRGV